MNLQSLDFLRASSARLVASRLVERLGLTSKSFTAQQLIDLATTRSGRRDLGDTDFSNSLYGNLEQLLADFATTPEQHRALARYFKEKAADHRAVADKHGAMAQSYSGGKARDAELMREQSQKIAESEAAIAARYEAMAQAHQAEARQ